MPNSLFDLIKKSKDPKDLRHLIPRDEYGNEIKFAQPAPQPYAIPRDQYGNEIKVDPKELIKPLEQAVMERRLNNAKGKEKTMYGKQMQGLLGMTGQPQQMAQASSQPQAPNLYDYQGQQDFNFDQYQQEFGMNGMVFLNDVFNRSGIEVTSPEQIRELFNSMGPNQRYDIFQMYKAYGGQKANPSADPYTNMRR